MKFAPLILPAFLACGISARYTEDSSWFGGLVKEQASVSDELKVPGENPLYYCASADDDILQIEKVDLSPNPPEPGKTLSIVASGTFRERVEKGAKVHLQVKYGLITLINQEADLCDHLSEVDLECPLEEGKTTIKKNVDLPKEIPPGNYQVLANVFTNDTEATITCLKARVTFGRR